MMIFFVSNTILAQDAPQFNCGIHAINNVNSNHSSVMDTCIDIQNIMEDCIPIYLNVMSKIGKPKNNPYIYAII
jgi:hypothetical protein